MKLSNLRYEKNDSTARIVCDIESEFYRNKEKSIWCEVPLEFGEWLSRDVYDAFVVALLYPCMKHKDDIEVKGAMSERLWRNLKNYAQACMCDFSTELSRIEIKADRFKIPEKRFHHIGAGFSGGVDSFSVIVDRYEKETNPKYKVDTLLCFNAGSHGDFDDPQTLPKYKARYQFLRKYPEEVGLPFIPVNTNIHAFMDEGHQQSGITRHISVPMALQAAFDRYYYASALSYYEEKYFGRDQFNFDLSEFCEPHFLPWLSTESIELVSEGGQYKRTQKTENIVNYKYAQKYLNVCINSNVSDAKNCSYCLKCMRTLIAIQNTGGGRKIFQMYSIWTNGKSTNSNTNANYVYFMEKNRLQRTIWTMHGKRETKYLAFS